MISLRQRLLVALPLFVLCGVFVVVKEVETISLWWRHAFVDALWGLFSLGAAIACFWTARGLAGRGPHLA